MKVSSLKWALPGAVLALCLSVSVQADDVRTMHVSKGGLEGKVQYCSYCHGSSGQGYRGYYPMPRLAGQQSEYFVNQLRAFAEGRRDRHFAMNMSKVHGVSPSMRSALASRFASLNPKPFGHGPSDQVAMGKRIFEEGVPDSNVPACGACHAPDGKGAGQNARLAGQMYAYTVRTLANWGKERESESSQVMQLIARNMSRSQISAVAAYVSTLR